MIETKHLVSAFGNVFLSFFRCLINFSSLTSLDQSPRESKWIPKNTVKPKMLLSNPQQNTTAKWTCRQTFCFLTDVKSSCQEDALPVWFPHTQILHWNALYCVFCHPSKMHITHIRNIYIFCFFCCLPIHPTYSCLWVTPQKGKGRTIEFCCIPFLIVKCKFNSMRISQNISRYKGTLIFWSLHRF